jgi:hypothetical protein
MSYYSDLEIPRAKEENPENLTELQLNERKIAISQIMLQYPDASPKNVELCWNYIRRKGLESVREEINTGYFNKPSEFAEPKGGLLKTAWIYEPDGSLSSSSSQTSMLSVG